MRKMALVINYVIIAVWNYDFTTEINKKTPFVTVVIKYKKTYNILKKKDIINLFKTNIC